MRREFSFGNNDEDEDEDSMIDSIDMTMVDRQRKQEILGAAMQFVESSPQCGSEVSFEKRLQMLVETFRVMDEITDVKMPPKSLED